MELARDMARLSFHERAAQQTGRIFDENAITEWCSVFGGVDLRKSPMGAKWHHGKLGRMVDACDPTGSAKAEYWVCSQATHPSPLGGRLASEDLRFIGFDSEALSMAVDAIMLHAYCAVRTFENALGVNIRQWVSEEFGEYLASRGVPIPSDL